MGKSASSDKFRHFDDYEDYENTNKTNKFSDRRKQKKLKLAIKNLDVSSLSEYDEND